MINADSKRTLYDKSRLDYVVRKVLKILNEYIDALRTNSCYEHISMPSALFLQHMRYFLEQYVLYRMYITPEQARYKELHYRKLWHSQKKSMKDIAIFTTNLERQRINHKKMLEDVIKQYRKNIITIDKIDRRCNEDIKNITEKHEKKQLILHKVWEVEQNEIKLALRNIIDDYESLKDINTELEGSISKQRLTTESKLLEILAKYDIEIGSRYRVLEELNETYEFDKLKKLMLEEEMKQQEKVYTACVKRKEETEMRRFHENLTTFKRERAAKLVQRWWRKIFEDKKAKRKVRKKIK